jgi:hypothetical protein
VNERELAEKIENLETIRDIGRAVEPEKCHHHDRSLTIKHASAANRESVDPKPYQFDRNVSTPVKNPVVLRDFSPPQNTQRKADLRKLKVSSLKAEH